MTHKLTKYIYTAKVLKVYDGDGKFELDISTVVDIGFEETLTSNRKKPARLYGVDTPEVRHNDKRHKEAGLIVKEFVQRLILGKEVTIHSIGYRQGKFGRILIDIEIEDRMLSEILLSKGYALPYQGESKKGLWTVEKIDVILNQYGNINT